MAAVPTPAHRRSLAIVRLLTILLAAAALTTTAQAARAPATSYPLTRAAAEFREQTWRLHPCLAQIIEWENGWWDPTIHNGGGHGDTSRSYGLPQALPGTKMASAGRDWRTSPATQLRWMRGYAVSRYGSECGALYHRQHYGTY